MKYSYNTLENYLYKYWFECKYNTKLMDDY